MMKKCSKKICSTKLPLMLLPVVVLFLVVGYVIGMLIPLYRIFAIIVVLAIYLIVAYSLIKAYDFKIVTNGEVLVDAVEDIQLDYKEVAEQIIKGLGGKENIVTIDNCITRLRLEVRDTDKVDKIILKEAGAVDTVILDKSSVQIIIGPKVQYIAEEMKKMQ